MQDGERDRLVDGGPGEDRATIDAHLDLTIRSIERFADTCAPLADIQPNAGRCGSPSPLERLDVSLSAQSGSSA
jgi:hypothetical protein